MADHTLSFTLSYTGEESDEHEIDFYDVAQALIGFQRSLALTTHLILNGEIITQAPSLKGARILAIPADEGSWKWTTIVVFSATALYHATTAPKDTPLGNLVSSAYDYVISESLGFHVDYNKTLGAQYEQYKAQHPDAKALTESKMDSLIEKCEIAVKNLHRPIIESTTASAATITASQGSKHKAIGGELSTDTFDYLQYTVRSEEAFLFTGRVSSYNMNTYKGRIYLSNTHRPVPFVLREGTRGKQSVRTITRSLAANALNPDDLGAEIQVRAYAFTSRTGRLKWILITTIDHDYVNPQIAAR